MTLRVFGDMYCWCCHMEDAMYSCKRCARSYHRRCVFEMPNYPEPVFNPDSMDPSLMESCPECVVADETILNNMKSVQPSQLNNILSYVIHNLKTDGIWSSNYYKILKPSSHSRSRAVIVKFMDIFTLEENVEADLYRTLEGFFGDAKWIRHNVAVTEGSNVNELYKLCKERSDEMNMADKLIQDVASEMLTIDLCHECYVRKQNQYKLENWFTTACSRPHLLGWAKIDNAVYWPVKVMGIDTGRSLAIVHSFGEHEQIEVPLKNTLIFSEDPPSSTKKLKGQILGWRKALKEMRKHMEYLEEKHGKVVLAEERKRINCTLTEAAQRMFPDWKLKIASANTLEDLEADADDASNDAD